MSVKPIFLEALLFGSENLQWGKTKVLSRRRLRWDSPCRIVQSGQILHVKLFWKESGLIFLWKPRLSEIHLNDFPFKQIKVYLKCLHFPLLTTASMFEKPTNENGTKLPLSTWESQLPSGTASWCKTEHCSSAAYLRGICNLVCGCYSGTVPFWLIHTLRCTFPVIDEYAPWQTS